MGELSIRGAQAQRNLLEWSQRVTYACLNCKENGISPSIIQTPREPALIPGSYASAEAVAHFAVQKFVMGSPLYRQEQEWNRQGFMISAEHVQLVDPLLRRLACSRLRRKR